AVAGTNVQSIGHIVYNSTATVSYAGNLFYNVKNSQCPSGSVCQDPKLTNTNLASFDAQPLAGSPVIDKVPVISGVTSDFVLAPRPSGAQADIGAYEVQAGGTTPPPTNPTPPPVDPTPAPVCTRATPSVSLSGSTAAVAAGSAVTYTVNVKNNDSAACANTSFALARTVPAGWTGTLSAGSVSLAPGASGSATLQVTSSATAAAGGYGIGTGVSSAAGSAHTASASATYTVAAPAAPAPTTLTETLTPSQSVYNAGTKVAMTARVLKAGVAVKGASVRFEAVKPDGVTKIAGTVITDASGYAKWSFVSGTGPSSIGSYKAKSVATSGTATVTASTTFQVK
ncbi:NEW3 domain-containing protein, partial [Lysobacter niastensis]